MKNYIQTKAVLFTVLLLIASIQIFGQRQMEYLDRGLVAVKVTNGVFLSWRVLGNDPKDMAFNIYRGTTKVNANPITGATNLTDASGTTGSTYTVRPIINGVEQAVGGSAAVWGQQYLSLQLQRPAGGTTPDGVAYTYAPNDCSVGDVDGDGQYEIFLKWDPSNAKDNSQQGYTGNVFIDCYKLNGTRLWRVDLGINIRAGAHYTQFLVQDFNGDGKAEMACKTAPGAKDGKGVYLSKGPAANDDNTEDYRTDGSWAGFISTGPEYLTMFSGLTGEELATESYIVNREPANGWGKTSETTNRVDRFLACVAYLDGKKPSMVFQRGYYGRMTLTAWDWNGTKLSQRWLFDSNTAGNGAAASQGNHNLSCGDVDGDGFDEILQGASAIDHNGKFMYATGLGHGDAMHFSDLMPDRPGLEVMCVHEEKHLAWPSTEVHDARTGEILWKSLVDDKDVGRGMSADISAAHRGFEVWSGVTGGFHNIASNTKVSTFIPSTNFRVYWDGDLQDELFESSIVEKWNGNGMTTLATLLGNTCNDTKKTPNLSADILGDWREEVILHDGASKLYIHTTTISTTHKLYTLMHDPVYRNAVAWQNAAYNQPPHLGFFLGDGAEKAPVPNITIISSTCQATPINPYFQINGGAWVNSTTIQATEGDVLILGPQPADGTWSWSGAGTSGTNREQTLTLNTGGTFDAVASYTNGCGATSLLTFNIQVTAIPRDCSGAVNGTAYLDNCGTCVGGNTGKMPCLSFEAEEACSFVGVLETTHAGFSGSGYVNSNNELNTSLKIGIVSQTTQNIDLLIKYANGGTENRPSSVSINGTLTSNNISFAPTNAWTTWINAPVSLALKEGYNEIVFTATTAGGLPNIDLFGYSSPNIAFSDCNIVQQSISLTSGWNLISINVLPQSTAIATIFAALDVAEIKTMNAYWKKVNLDFLNTLQTIEPGNGYLVNMNTAGTLSVTGVPVEARLIAPLQSAGWHLIGCPFQTPTHFPIISTPQIAS
ncbi:MAG: pseudouridine synthase [Bacteroidales bacterium]|nr:pseudouridine synthase [Bacteroidales bacterium]